MRPSMWPDWLDDVWAKSSGKGADQGEPETLALHTWSVVSRLAELIQLRPDLSEQLGSPSLWHCLYWASFLHDFGKVMPNFQGVLRGDKQAQNLWGSHRHEVFSLLALNWITAGLDSKEAIQLTACILSHHRDPDDISTLYCIPDEDEPDVLFDQLDKLKPIHTDGLYRFLVECGWAWAVSLGLEQYGVKSLTFTPDQGDISPVNLNKSIRKKLRLYEKWIEKLKQEQYHSIHVSHIALRGTVIHADHTASAHTGSFPRLDFKDQEITSKLTYEKPYLHQTQAAQFSGSVLLTAPTGSGKTEAALLWVANQAASRWNNLPRLFYALPYQASMNAMKLRLDSYYGEGRVGLQHGRSLMALYRMLLEKNYTPEEASRLAKWEKNLSKLNYLPVRVFSPYQMLKGIYRLKGYEALLTDYQQAVFIFDEIHAYDAKRLAIILKTIEYLRKYYGAQFLIMSATFPDIIKQRLRRVLDAPGEIDATPDTFAQFRRHRIKVLDGEIFSEPNLEKIYHDIKSNKSVLIVCNTVLRAQRIYDILKARPGESASVILLHGRFNMRDRSGKEETIRIRTGSKSSSRQPTVLISTQVVEVSLDIDLDTIYTDPAPLEALVQRFGRVNRRRLQSELAPVCVFEQPDDGQSIYDEKIVKCALNILKRYDGQALDESAVGKWLDEIYSGEIAAQWCESYEKAAQAFERDIINTIRPFATDKKLEEAFYKAFDSIEVLPESLYEEYTALMETEPFRAGELFVPITWGRYHMLANQGKMLPRDGKTPPVVRTEYNSELGLIFDQPQNEDI